MKLPMPRSITPQIKTHLARGKSILLLGARQTGKTTLVETFLKPDMYYTFAKLSEFHRYNKQPELFENELLLSLSDKQKPPLVFVDEIQKIPILMDSVQHIIDKQLAQFILTGSSARKLVHGKHINLLPGRVTAMTLNPLLYEEITNKKPSLEQLLIYGSLPMVVNENYHPQHCETDLFSYVSTYLEEEVRAEAIVRNIGGFARFLELSAAESGNIINASRLSQDIGVASSTITEYYQILEDCLIAHRIDPLTESTTKRRLIKAPKYIYFDLGVRRACANEGPRLSQRILGNLFEQYVGNTLLYNAQLTSPHIKIKYWRDSAGPEIDFIIDNAKQYIPIEVKWHTHPSEKDARHLQRFLNEYKNTEKGYIVCRTPKTYSINKNIIAIPWEKISTLFDKPS